VGALALATIAGIAATPHASAAPSNPLPDLASVEAVVGAQQAWMSGAYGQGVDVAVLDTGVTPVAGLDAPDKVVYGPDLSFDSQGPTTNLDGFGHGTAMASIIAGNDYVPGGFKGVAPGARILSVKVGAANGAVDVSQIIAGIDWVVEHAHDNGMNVRVLNLSLGTSSSQAWQIDPLAQAAENAWDHGIVVVASAGNDGSASHEVADPASDPYVLTVGAEDPQGTIDGRDDTVPDFSQRGTGKRHPDVVAPGAYVMGLNVPGSTLSTSFPGAVYGRYLRGSGTSQAAAVASGAAADLLSVYPTLTPDQVKWALTHSADKIKEKNPNFVGDGLVDIPGALAAAPKAKDTPQKIKGPKQGPHDKMGSLEQSRGNSHIQLNGVDLTGEQDIFGHTWTTDAMQAAEADGATWSGGVYNGATWSGATWSSATWSGATWSGATWSGATWSGATWSGATWSGATWSGATWSGATWSSATWSGATWSGATWSGATWSGATWS
jgi:serine protease AprX